LLQRAVKAGSAAADLWVAHLDEIDAGDGADQIARLLANPLGMREMARILVGHAQFHLAIGRRKADLGQPLAQVFDAPFEGRVEVLEVSAAAGGVDDERVELSRFVDAHVRFAQARGPVEVPVVREQCATAALAGRKPHLAARELQEPDRGVV